MKIVCDTNVYLAANKISSYARLQLKRSRPGGSFQLYISLEIILEVRTKLEQKFSYTPSDSADFIEMIMRYATMVYPKRRVTNVLRDTSDHIILECVILECALEVRADFIMTADRGLLQLKSFEGITISHPTLL